MTKTLLAIAVVPALLLSACATTTPATTASPLAEAADDIGLPRLREPARIPDSGLLGQRVATWRGGEISADVHVCVAPDGKVAEVALARSSGLTAYDTAVVDGAGRWSYEPFAGAPRCQTVAVAYVVK
jgi:TonB family protein